MDEPCFDNVPLSQLSNAKLEEFMGAILDGATWRGGPCEDFEVAKAIAGHLLAERELSEPGALR